MAEEDGGDVGQHHAGGGAGGDDQHVVVARRQRHGGDLGLVADLHQEERDGGGQEDAHAPAAGLVLILFLVGDERPERHDDERDGDRVLNQAACRMLER